MPINKSSIRGMHNMKTSADVCKSPFSTKEEYLKFYMLELKKTRLNIEKEKTLLRLESINIRLTEIQDFFEKNIEQAPNSKQENVRDDEKTEFKTMSIDY